MSKFPMLKIAMVGPRGVGKTSVLAAMYEELEAELAGYGCNFSAKDRTTEVINKQRRALEEVSRAGTLLINNKVGLQGSTDLREYDFSFNITGEKDATLNLQFVDMPGEWYLNSDSRMVEVLRQSRASIWVIDATALMENDGEFNNSINDPKSIYNAFKTAFKNRDSGRHDIIMTLVRAETYLQKDKNGNDRREVLLQKLSLTYKDLIERLRNQLKENFDDVIDVCCIETMGNAYFHLFKNADTTNPQAEFVVDRKKGYSPSGCSRPLRAALLLTLFHALGMSVVSMKACSSRRKQLANELREQVRKGNILGRIGRIFGFKPLSDSIVEVICKMAEHIKDDDYSEI